MSQVIEGKRQPCQERAQEPLRTLRTFASQSAVRKEPAEETEPRPKAGKQPILETHMGYLCYLLGQSLAQCPVGCRESRRNDSLRSISLDGTEGQMQTWGKGQGGFINFFFSSISSSTLFCPSFRFWPTECLLTTQYITGAVIYSVKWWSLWIWSISELSRPVELEFR